MAVESIGYSSIVRLNPPAFDFHSGREKTFYPPSRDGSLFELALPSQQEANKLWHISAYGMRPKKSGMRMRKKVDVGRGRTDGDGRTRGTGGEIPVMGEEWRGKEGRLLWPEGRETEEERGEEGEAD